jgi:hypothetical protein
MINLILSLNTAITNPALVSSNYYPPVTCDMITVVPKVCNKRVVVMKDHPTKYYLTLTDGKGEFEVSKCTYNASFLYGYYVVSKEGKWCDHER